MPEILPENIDAWNVWTRIATQVIIAPDGKVIGIDLTTAIKVMEILEIRNKKDCLDKIIFISNQIYKQ